MALAAQLNLLESTDLIRLAQTQPEVEYLFRHALIQEAAYGSLVKSDRRHLHQAVGEALERGYPDRLGSAELAPLLGAHFFEAGDDLRALKYFTLAGDAAARVYANSEAALHYTRALEVAQRATRPEGPSHVAGEQLTHLYTQCGRALELSGQYDQALRNYVEMETLARERGDRSMELSALILRATVHSAPTARYDAAQAQALCDRALRLAGELGDRRAEAKILWNLMLLNKFRRTWREMFDYGEQSLALARELGLREQVAYVLNDLGPAYVMLGQRDRAQVALDEARELWRALDNKPMLADNLSSSAGIHIQLGEYEPALSLAEEAYRVSQSIGNLWGQSYSLWHVASVYLERGEIGKGLEAAQDAIRLGEQAGFAVVQVACRALLALAYGFMGNVARGLDLARLALTKADELLPSLRPLALAELARLHLLGGNVAEAEAALQEAHQSIAPEDRLAHVFLAQADIELGLAQGDYERVVDRVDGSIDALRQFKVRAWLPHALQYKGRALLGQGRTDEAHDLLIEARAEAEALGSRRILWEILYALSQVEARRGSDADAQRLRQQAREIVEFIAGHTGSPELRQSFLNLPDVQNVMRET